MNDVLRWGQVCFWGNRGHIRLCSFRVFVGRLRPGDEMLPRFPCVDLRAPRSSKSMKGILAALNQENLHGQQEHDLPLV